MLTRLAAAALSCALLASRGACAAPTASAPDAPRAASAAPDAPRAAPAAPGAPDKAQPAPPAPAKVELPLVACETEDGVETPPSGKALPHTLAMPQALAGPLSAGKGLAAYALTHGAPPFALAPRGWSCKGILSADSSIGISVKAPSGPGDIELGLTPACLGCQLQSACGYLASAAAELKETFAELACPAVPAGRKVRLESKELARWSDGTSRGWLLYLGDGNGMAQASCTLAEPAPCEALLDAMLEGARAALGRTQH